MQVNHAKAIPSTELKASHGLSAERWRLRGPAGEFVGMDARYQASFVPESEALIFGILDNWTIRLPFYQSLLGPLTIEVL